MAKQSTITANAVAAATMPLVDSGSRLSFLERGFESIGPVDVPGMNVSAEAFVETRQYQGANERILHLAMPKAFAAQLVRLSALKRATQIAELATLPGDPIDRNDLRKEFTRLMTSYMDAWKSRAGEQPKSTIERDGSEGYILVVDGKRWFLREGWSAFTPTFVGESTTEEYQAKRTFRQQQRQSSLATVSLKPVTQVDDFDA
jgi:hypothetical protein